MVVYLIRNTVNNKVYIGKTVHTLAQRWPCHVSSAKAGSNYYIHRAIRKYGIDVFEVNEICSAKTEADLLAIERIIIEQFKSNNPQYGYNMTEGGEGTSGIKRSPETITRLKESHLGYKRSEESKRAQSEAQRGRKYPLEWRKAISDSLKGRTGSYGNRGHKHSDETKNKMRKAKIGYVFSDEHRKKLSDAAFRQWQKVKQNI